MFVAKIVQSSTEHNMTVIFLRFLFNLVIIISHKSYLGRKACLYAYNSERYTDFSNVNFVK